MGSVEASSSIISLAKTRPFPERISPNGEPLCFARSSGLQVPMDIVLSAEVSLGDSRRSLLTKQLAWAYGSAVVMTTLPYK
jgi:hypothetical protein